jgi:hypothetical protein
MSYSPTEIDEFDLSWLQNELYSISDSISTNEVHKIHHVEPVKRQDGLVVIADGVDWDPLSLSGLTPYRAMFSNGVWIGGVGAGAVSSGVKIATSKAGGQAITPTAGAAVFITSDDGGLFKAVTGAAVSTYSDDGGSYCGTVFIPTGGDGSTAWIRTFKGATNIKWFGADKTGTINSAPLIENAMDSLPVVGSTTDIPSLEYRNGVIYVPAGEYKLSTQMTIPLGVSIAGDSQTTNYNIAGLTDESFGSTFWLDNTTTFPAIKIDGKQLRGSAASIQNIKFTHGQTKRQSGPYTGSAVELDGVFMFNLLNCDFFELGFSTAFKCTDSNGVSVNHCRFIKIGDANNQQSMPPASGYTHGTAIDFTTCYDSFVTSTFIESCGGTGVILSTNTKVENCFIDLCNLGVESLGDRNQIVGSSIKWHQSHGILLTSSDGMVISSNVIMGNNYKSSDTSSTAGFAIRFDSTSSKYVVISNNNLVDDYESIAGHNPYKTVRQAGIHLGSGTSTTAIITGNFFSDVDAQWDSTISTGYPILDTVGHVASGTVMAATNMLEAGGPAANVNYPFTTAAATTPGSVVKRIAYRDKNGTVVGQIPLYNTIT